MAQSPRIGPASGHENITSPVFSPATGIPTTRRASSIRFSDGTSALSKSPMSRRRPTSSSDHEVLTESPDRVSSDFRPSQDEPAQPRKPSANEQTNSEDQKESIAWYKRIAEKYGSVTLENKQSVARDHLALERTFLAWLRTSLAFASIGIAITQLFRLNVTYRSQTEQYAMVPTSQLPYSPLMGQSIPAELIPLLQQLCATALPSSNPAPVLGPTLLDQLLLLPPYTPVSDKNNGASIPAVHTKAFDEDAAARLRHVGKPLGATFLGISIIILFIGFHRYFHSQYWIIQGKFPASRGSIAMVGLITGSLIIASLVVTLVITPTSFTKK